MFRLFLLLVAAAVVFAKPQMMFGLDEEWNSFKKVYGKNYAADGITELFRRGIWENNLAYIQSHNLQADRGVHSYTLGMNHLGDMTREEFTHMLNGYTNNKSQTGSSFLPASNIGVLPKRVDWRKEGYVTHVKNQGQCGSCWAFSATGSLEGQHFKKTGKLVSLSEQNLVDCSGPEGNYGCNGGLMTQSFTYIAKNGGIDTEQSYPYIGRNGQCHFTEANIGATDVGFVNIPKMNESSLQQAVASVGPISAAMDASHSSWQFYQSGIYNEPACSSTTLDHGILVVGYGFSSEGEYWIVKNTYGVGWGMQGYVLMSRNKNNQCGIATLTSYPLV